MNQNEKAPFGSQASELHPLSDQQLQKVSGGVIVPWTYIEYECTGCSNSIMSDANMERCPRCGGWLKVLDYIYDEPSLE